MPALGSNPFEFTDPDGKQISIPLAALNFDKGELTVGSAWPALTAAVKKIVTPFLAELNTNQVFTAPPAVVPKPAMLVTASDTGVAGNNITVEVTKKPSADLNPANTTFDITVIETEVYPGLTMDTIEAVVGTGETPGSKPGLAHVLSGSLNKTLLPAAQTVTFPTAAEGKATVDIMDALVDEDAPDEDAAPQLVFTLEARKPWPGGATATAVISAVDSEAKTFTLTLKWELKVTGAKALADLAPLSDEITATAPTSGAFSIPATTAAPVALSGGSESAAASAVLTD